MGSPMLMGTFPCQQYHRVMQLYKDLFQSVNRALVYGAVNDGQKVLQFWFLVPIMAYSKHLNMLKFEPF